MNLPEYPILYKSSRYIVPLLGVFAMSFALAQGAIQVPVVPAQFKSVGTGFELDGVIQPVKQSTISAQAAGRMATLVVKAGDKVKAGQLLASIDDRETQTGVQRSQAQVAQAQAELRNAQANFDRTRDLQSKGFVSAAALDTADSQLKGALAGRDQAGAGARQSALAQGFTRVTAPYDGWVLQTHVEAGDLAVPGKPLLTLYAPLPIRAVVQVPVSRSGVASAAGTVEVLLQNGEGAAQWVRPVSSSTVPTADPVSQTIEWRLELPAQAAKSLLPGQQIRVRFTGNQADRMVVPGSAVLRRGELTAVYVASGKGFVLKAVRLGAEHGADGVEVAAGLLAGDRVALDPVRAGLAGAQPIAQPTAVK
ncbi:MAG: efflux RND transporter periplasmic adaptor subunit [Burkholderiaceae bacterium]|nr:efflux RND transporter periplasmic adaptor subunit [Burkholderiaceae bacterium]